MVRIQSLTKIYWTFTVNCVEKTKIEKKKQGLGHFLTIMTVEIFDASESDSCRWLILISISKELSVSCQFISPIEANWVSYLTWAKQPPIIEAMWSSFLLSSSCEHLSGQSYKASTILIYDSRVIPDLIIPHVMTLDL